MRVLVAAIALALLLAGGGAGAGARPLRVLFVGNSLTETNDLPARVAALARSAGTRLEYRAIVFGGFNLEDHWNQGDARAALATKSWDVVVMQQGPSALPESQVDLRRWATRWADEARLSRLFKMPLVGIRAPFRPRTARIVQKSAAQALGRPVRRPCS